jgi:hypothetical protein
MELSSKSAPGAQGRPSDGGSGALVSTWRTGLERTQGTVSYAGVWGEYGDFRRLAKVVLPKELGRYHSEPTQTRELVLGRLAWRAIGSSGPAFASPGEERRHGKYDREALVGRSCLASASRQLPTLCHLVGKETLNTDPSSTSDIAQR